MSDEKALLAAIWAHPQEDTPRLVYADWLQENGQPERAEFIRVQCELASTEDNARRATLEELEARLWKKHAKSWKAGLPKLLQTASFQRGFPNPRRRAVTGNQFLKLSMSELLAAPLWDFRIHTAEKTIAHVVAHRAMTRVGTLEISAQEMIDRGAEVLTAANFPNLAQLHLGANWIGEGGMVALAGNPSVRSLQDLIAYSSDLSDKALAILVKALWFPSLRSLFLGNNPFRDQGLRSLAGAAGNGSLRQLGISGLTVGSVGKRFNDKSLVLLVRSPQLANLTGLDLAINYIGDSGVEVMCSEAPLFRLRNLNLDSNAISDRGAELLAAWPGLQTVETLTLSNNAIGSPGALALARSPNLTRLRNLWLMDNPIAERAGMEASRTQLVDRFRESVRFGW